MLGLPKFTPTCARCRKPREGLFHTCVSTSNRAATTRLKTSWPRCPTCGKDAKPFHPCGSKRGDFGRRRKAASKKSAPKRSTSNRHDYSACPDPRNCSRSACVAYREGLKLGAIEGFDSGYEVGFIAGQNACPLPHSA